MTDSTDWAAEIRDARLRGMDLMADMTDEQWAEYRAQCRRTRAGSARTPDGRARQERRTMATGRQRRRFLDEKHTA